VALRANWRAATMAASSAQSVPVPVQLVDIVGDVYIVFAA
jgi:hypothetical protein